MESYNKNWGRCNISKKGLVSFLIKNFLLVLIISTIFLFIINYRLKKTLNNYISIEAERITSYVVNQSIKDVNISSRDYIYLDNNNYSYNLVVINDYKDRLSKKIR